jgi:hypothetical protein
MITAKEDNSSGANKLLVNSDCNHVKLKCIRVFWFQFQITTNS